MNLVSPMAQLRHLAQRAWAAVPIAAQGQCVVCGRRVQRFLPYRDHWPDMPPVLTELEVVGSDIENFECPACGCHDRERHLWLYLQACGLERRFEGAHILHMAPERHLQRLISRARPAEYLMGDLYPTRGEIRRMDLTQLDAAEGHFDFVIANHVLEHVDDDVKALREIFRVLRPGGQAILQTPFALRLPYKREDAAIRTAADRLQHYGQEDHCRLYGANFPGFVASFGFVPRTATHASLLRGVDSKRMGVNPQEPFLLFGKPGS